MSPSTHLSSTSCRWFQKELQCQSLDPWMVHVVCYQEVRSHREMSLRKRWTFRDMHRIGRARSGVTATLVCLTTKTVTGRSEQSRAKDLTTCCSVFPINPTPFVRQATLCRVVHVFVGGGVTGVGCCVTLYKEKEAKVK